MDGNNMIKARRNQEYYLVLLVGMCVATGENKKLSMSIKHTDENNTIKAGQNQEYYLVLLIGICVLQREETKS